MNTQVTRKKFNCHKCNKSYTQKAKLNYHLKVIHTKGGIEENKCTYCPKSFCTKHGREQHERVLHLGERRYNCEHCSAKFSTLYGLRGHITGQHGTKLKCESCDSEFAYKHTLKEHQAKCGKNIGIKEFGCVECLRKYTSKRALDAHKDAKHSGKTTVCEICGDEFQYKFSYRRHKKNKHKL